MSTNELRNRHRRLREYLTTEQPSLREAVHAVSPAITPLDTNRVLTWLKANIDTYPGPNRRARQAFKMWAVNWVQSVTRMILNVRDMAPALTAAAESAVPGLPRSDYRLAVSRVENHIVDLVSIDSPDLPEWAYDRAVYEARGLAEWPKWRRCPIIRLSIYEGLWRCLNQCADLGLGEVDDAGKNTVIETLADDVWVWAHSNAGTLVEGPVPVGARLLKKAYWLAREWKTNQIRDDEDFIALEAADRTRFYDEPTPAKRVDY